MSETGHDIQRLATQIAAGSITYDFITSEYGSDMTSSVMGLVAGGVTGFVAGEVYEVAREVPVVGDVLDASAEIVGDVVDGFLDFF